MFSEINFINISDSNKSLLISSSLLNESIQFRIIRQMAKYKCYNLLNGIFTKEFSKRVIKFVNCIIFFPNKKPCNERKDEFLLVFFAKHLT